jgi:thiol-disulfide isomerase/thioredoxin
MNPTTTRFAVAAVLLSTAGFLLGVPPPPEPPLVTATKAAVKRGDLSGAESLVAAYRQQHGDSSEAIEAFSWLARGSLMGGFLDHAMDQAEQTQRLVIKALQGRGIDSDPYLGIALGAAFEVEATAMNQMGQKSEAVRLLETSLTTYRHTSLVARLRKNLNLLTLTGKTAPPLQMTDLLVGARPPTGNAAAAAPGKVRLLFFWAHWCPDCKAQAPAIARIAASLEPKGLQVIAPTRLYGYAAGGADTTPFAERDYIRTIFDKYYSLIPGLTVPLDPADFDIYGVSTTPTLVVVDRHGVVKLYHPGTLSEQELRAAIAPLL